MAKGKREEAGVVQVELKMAERLALLGLLPQQATYGTLKMVKGLQEQLLPDEGELEKLPGYEDQAGSVRWDAKKERGRKFSFSGLALKLIVEKLQALDKEEKLTLSQVDLWEKFVEPAEQPA